MGVTSLSFLGGTISQQISGPLLQCFVSLTCSVYVVDVLIGAGCPMITCSRRFNWLWFPIWSPFAVKEASLMRGTRQDKLYLSVSYEDELWECFRNYAGLGEQW